MESSQNCFSYKVLTSILALSFSLSQRLFNHHFHHMAKSLKVLVLDMCGCFMNKVNIYTLSVMFQPGDECFLDVGNDNDIREHSSIHRSSKSDDRTV